MASKELKTIIDRLKKAKEELAQAFAKTESTDKDNPNLQVQEAIRQLKLHTDFPMVVFNENPTNYVFHDVKVLPVKVNNIKCEWLVATDSNPDTRLLYIHGGGFVCGGLDTHRHLSAQIAKAGGCSVLAVDYRLAPNNPYPAALDDCFNVYLGMIENSPFESKGAKKTFIAGDSAGGNLTLATLLKLKELRKSLPNAAITLSASTDETRSLNSWITRVDVDPLLGGFAEMLRKEAGKKSPYLQGHDPKDSLVSPLFGELSGLSPLFMQAGDAECLRDDTEEFAKKAKAAGVDVTAEIWPEMIHTWQAYAPILPEAVEAISRIGSFIKKHI